jgi:hypothetical protein
MDFHPVSLSFFICFCLLMPPKSAKPSETPASTGSHASWTGPAEAELVAHYQQAKSEGKMSNNNFKATVHKAAVEHLCNKGFENFTASQCKTCWNRVHRTLCSYCTSTYFNQQFKAEFKIVAKLRTLSGFGWDAVWNMVVADDKVWDA